MDAAEKAIGSETLSRTQARRVALEAQGFFERRPGANGTAVTMRHVQRTIDRLHLLQIDSVNVFARAHLMPLFSRLGPYRQELVERACTARPRRLLEYWAHEASLVTPEVHRLLRWRTRRAHLDTWGSMRRAVRDHPELLEDVRALIRSSGPLTAAQVSELVKDSARPKEGWGWRHKASKWLLEYLFYAGEVSSAGRTAQFARRYDLTERIVPYELGAAEQISEEDAFYALMLRASQALGVGTAAQLRDYFRISARDVRAPLARLVETGELLPVKVEGVGPPAYLAKSALDHKALSPRSAIGKDAPLRSPRPRALLSPFDPLVFERRRVQELFDFHYRIEIYVPESRRRYGYYVLPFLLGDALCARVDLKADRGSGTLFVGGAFAEENAPDDVAHELAAELLLAAQWLGLSRVAVGERGGLTSRLREEISRVA